LFRSKPLIAIFGVVSSENIERLNVAYNNGILSIEGYYAFIRLKISIESCPLKYA
jgi:hypothetical protein